MEEWVQRIAIYIVLVAVLRSMIGRPQYQQYFRFVSGLILILLLITPVLGIFRNNSDVYEILNRYLYQQDLEEWEASLELAEGQMKEMIREEYRQSIASQIVEIGRMQGISVQEVSVTLDAQNQVSALEIHISSAQDAPTKAVLHDFRNQVELYYQLGEESVVIWL